MADAELVSTPRFKSLEGAKEWLARYRERLKEKGHDIRMAAEEALIPLSAIALFGIFEGYYGADKLTVFKDTSKPEGEQGGVPVTLGVGLLGYVLSMTNVVGHWGHELRMFSNGAIYYWSVDKFRSIGQKWKEKADSSSSSSSGTTGGASHYRGPWMGSSRSPQPLPAHHGIFQPEEARAFDQAARYGQ